MNDGFFDEALGNVDAPVKFAAYVCSLKSLGTQRAVGQLLRKSSDIRVPIVVVLWASYSGNPLKIVRRCSGVLTIELPEAALMVLWASYSGNPLKIVLWASYSGNPLKIVRRCSGVLTIELP